jgi:hypothetical protein
MVPEPVKVAGCVFIVVWGGLCAALIGLAVYPEHSQPRRLNLASAIPQDRTQAAKGGPQEVPPPDP